VISEWPTPRSLTNLRGLFGLFNYYRFFVKLFSLLDVPLTNMTKNGTFRWSEEEQRAFDRTKKVMSTFQVLFTSRLLMAILVGVRCIQRGDMSSVDI